MKIFAQIEGKKVTLLSRTIAPGIVGDFRNTLKPTDVAFGWSVTKWIESGPGEYKIKNGRPVKIG